METIVVSNSIVLILCLVALSCSVPIEDELSSSQPELVALANDDSTDSGKRTVRQVAVNVGPVGVGVGPFGGVGVRVGPWFNLGIAPSYPRAIPVAYPAPVPVAVPVAYQPYQTVVSSPAKYSYSSDYRYNYSY